MTDYLQNRDVKTWLNIERVIGFGFFLFYMMGKLNYYLADSLLHSYFIILAVIVVSFSLYFFRLHDGKEIKILAAFWLWFTISRILGGDVMLNQYGVLLLSLAVCFSLTGLGMRSSSAERNRDLSVLSIAVCAFYFIMGVICLYGMFLRKPVLNPITNSYIVYSAPDRFIRMGLFEVHSNITAAMFMIPVFLLMHQMAYRKKTCITILAVPMIIVYLLCIGLTYSRNGMICTSLGVALFVSLLFFRSLKNVRMRYRIAVVFLSVIVIVPLGYKTIEYSVKLFGQGSAAWFEIHQIYSHPTEQIPDVPDDEDTGITSTMQQEESASVDTKTLFEDKRDFARDARTLTARTPLFRSAFLALKEEPIRILIGENDDEKMLYYANNVVQTEQHFAHMHNFLLQTLMVTGLPGLLLVLWFCIRLAICCVHVFFQRQNHLADTVLVIPIACYLLFFQLESGLFTDVTVVTLFFFLVAGYVIRINDSASAESAQCETV